MILGMTEGPLVTELQAKLEVQANGSYDRATQLAILGWQLDRGWPANGLVDEAMWIELFGSLPSTKSKFNSNAKDSDGDGLVQEGTPFERPASKQ